MWVAKFAEEYNMPELQTQTLHMGCGEWLLITLSTMLLYLIPAFLGGLVRYVVFFMSLVKHVLHTPPYLYNCIAVWLTVSHP